MAINIQRVSSAVADPAAIKASEAKDATVTFRQFDPAEVYDIEDTISVTDGAVDLGTYEIQKVYITADYAEYQCRQAFNEEALLESIRSTIKDQITAIINRDTFFEEKDRLLGGTYADILTDNIANAKKFSEVLNILEDELLEVVITDTNTATIRTAYDFDNEIIINNFGRNYRFTKAQIGKAVPVTERNDDLVREDAAQVNNVLTIMFNENLLPVLQALSKNLERQLVNARAYKRGLADNSWTPANVIAAYSSDTGKARALELYALVNGFTYFSDFLYYGLITNRDRVSLNTGAVAKASPRVDGYDTIVTKLESQIKSALPTAATGALDSLRIRLANIAGLYNTAYPITVTSVNPTYGDSTIPELITELGYTEGLTMTKTLLNTVLDFIIVGVELLKTEVDATITDGVPQIGITGTTLNAPNPNYVYAADYRDRNSEDIKRYPINASNIREVLPQPYHDLNHAIVAVRNRERRELLRNTITATIPYDPRVHRGTKLVIAPALPFGSRWRVDQVTHRPLDGKSDIEAKLIPTDRGSVNSPLIVEFIRRRFAIESSEVGELPNENEYNDKLYASPVQSFVMERLGEDWYNIYAYRVRLIESNSSIIQPLPDTENVPDANGTDNDIYSEWWVLRNNAVSKYSGPQGLQNVAHNFNEGFSSNYKNIRGVYAYIDDSSMLNLIYTASNSTVPVIFDDTTRIIWQTLSSPKLLNPVSGSPTLSSNYVQYQHNINANFFSTSEDNLGPLSQTRVSEGVFTGDIVTITASPFQSLLISAEVYSRFFEKGDTSVQVFTRDDNLFFTHAEDSRTSIHTNAEHTVKIGVTHEGVFYEFVAVRVADGFYSVSDRPFYNSPYTWNYEGGCFNWFDGHLWYIDESDKLYRITLTPQLLAFNIGR